MGCGQNRWIGGCDRTHMFIPFNSLSGDSSREGGRIVLTELCFPTTVRKKTMSKVFCSILGTLAGLCKRVLERKGVTFL